METAPEQTASQPIDVNDLKTQIQQLSKQMELQKEFSSMREQVNLQLSYFKWVGTTFGIVIAILGFFGFKAWSDLRDAAQKKIDAAIADMSHEAFDLSHGFAMEDAHRYREAIPYLTRCYERNHYDEPVLIVLLDALSSDNDYQSAFAIVQELKKNPTRFREFKSPTLYNNLGRVLLFRAIDDENMMDEAYEMFDKSLRGFGPDDQGRMYPLYNLFRFYVIKGDLSRAAKYLAAAYQLDSAYGSETHADDIWVVKLQTKRPTARSEVQKLLSDVRKSRP